MQRMPSKPSPDRKKSPTAKAVPVHVIASTMKLLRLKVELMEVAPEIHREIVVPASFTLDDLHVTLQIVMGWQNCHLHDFTIGKTRYADPVIEEEFDGISGEDEHTAILAHVASKRGLRFTYQYDFGDSWQHGITVVAINDGDPNEPAPACISGARACPTEDCGGPYGFMDLMAARAKKPRARRPDECEQMEWLGDFDPNYFDLDAVNAELSRAFRPKRKRAK